MSNGVNIIKNINNNPAKIYTTVLGIIELILVIVIILSFYLTMELNSKRVINIPKGSTSAIISYLDKNNYNVNVIDTLVTSMIGFPQSGWIDLKDTKMTKLDFLYKLTTSKAAMEKVTLLPGETYYFFLQDAAQKLDISTYKLFEEYAYQAYRKDGNILAETYHLPKGMDEKELITYLLNTTEKRYKELSLKIFGIYDKKNWYDKYITIASIIQKEAASKDEMAKVSSVIYNRLNAGMKLQMDGTLNYSKYSHIKVTPKMIKEDQSKYNTYKNKGLPDNPVCAVEIEAIKSALFPAKTKYLYFMKKPDGSGHIFSESYKKHKRVIRKVKKELRKIDAKKKLAKKKTVIKSNTLKTIKAKTSKKENSKKGKVTPQKTISNSEKLKSLWN